MTTKLTLAHPLPEGKLEAMSLEDLKVRIDAIAMQGLDIPEAELKAYWVARSKAPGHHFGRCEAREMLAMEWPDEFPAFIETEGCYADDSIC